MCILMGKTFVVFWNNFLLFQSFWVDNATIDFLNKKMVLSVVFIKLKFRMLQTGLSDLKDTKQLKFGLW